MIIAGEVGATRERTLSDDLPDASALEGGSRAIKEYLGFWVYCVNG